MSTEDTVHIEDTLEPEDTTVQLDGFMFHTAGTTTLRVEELNLVNTFAGEQQPSTTTIF